MLKFFHKEYNEKELVNHGDYYKSLNKCLREKPRGSDISRKLIYEAEKKRNGVSPVAREEIRVGGRPKIKKEVIVVYDFLLSVVNNSLGELGAVTETEEERAEKNLAFLIERAKENMLRQKTDIHRVGMVEFNIDNKKEKAKEMVRLFDHK
jgi:hypothetical protein